MITLLKILPFLIGFSLIVYGWHKIDRIATKREKQRRQNKSVNQIRQTNGCWNSDQRRSK